MLGFVALSQTPISDVSTGATPSVATALGAAIVSGLAFAKAYAVGTITGVAFVASVDDTTYDLPLLRGMNRQPVNAVSTISNAAIAVLETF